MKIRLATSKDNEKLLALESTLTQGSVVSVNFLKKDFLFHDNFFQNYYYIAEENNEIIASMALGIKIYHFKGQKIRGGYVHSLRIKKEYQTKPVREFVNFLYDFFKLIKKESLDFVYGVIKSDNKKAMDFAKKRKFMPLETYSIGLLPTLKSVKLKGLNADFQKVVLDDKYYIVPEIIEHYKYKSVIFSFFDYSPYLSLKVYKIPNSLLLTAKMFFGKDAVNKFEENNRTLSYSLLNIISAENKREVKELIKLKKNFCYENNINILGIINRSAAQTKFHLRTESTVFIYFNTTQFSKEQFLLDIM